MAKKKATATLKVSHKLPIDATMRGFRLGGFIYNDSRGVFADGTFITTSPVRDFRSGVGEWLVAITRSGTEYNIEYVDVEKL